MDTWDCYKLCQLIICLGVRVWRWLWGETSFFHVQRQMELEEGRTGAGDLEIWSVSVRMVLGTSGDICSLSSSLLTVLVE